jgi:hypothetical protein
LFKVNVAGGSEVTVDCAKTRSVDIALASRIAATRTRTRRYEDIMIF